MLRSNCFTSGDGPSSNGLPCIFPFSYMGTTYTKCVRLQTVLPLQLSWADLEEYPSKWCATVADYNSSRPRSWGFCGSCPTDELYNSVPSSDTRRFTLSGCPCSQSWKVLGHAPCRSSCCSPDGDETLWCMTEDPECEPSGWGYCADAQSVPNSLQVPESSWFDVIEYLQGPITAKPSTSSPSFLPTSIPSSAQTDAPISKVTPSPTRLTSQPTVHTGKPTFFPSSIPTSQPIQSAPTAERNTPTSLPTLDVNDGLVRASAGEIIGLAVAGALMGVIVVLAILIAYGRLRKPYKGESEGQSKGEPSAQTPQPQSAGDKFRSGVSGIYARLLLRKGGEEAEQSSGNQNWEKLRTKLRSWWDNIATRNKFDNQDEVASTPESETEKKGRMARAVTAAHQTMQNLSTKARDKFASISNRNRNSQPDVQGNEM